MKQPLAILSGIPIFTLQLSRRGAMPSVVHFEITADDLERAIKFYTNVFGWQIRKQTGKRVIGLIESNSEPKQRITGALVQRFLAEDSTILTFDVASIDDCARNIVREGGKILPRPKIPYKVLDTFSTVRIVNAISSRSCSLTNLLSNGVFAKIVSLRATYTDLSSLH